MGHPDLGAAAPPMGTLTLHVSLDPGSGQWTATSSEWPEITARAESLVDALAEIAAGLGHQHEVNPPAGPGPLDGLPIPPAVTTVALRALVRSLGPAELSARATRELLRIAEVAEEATRA